jgi:hypothetical protein
MAPHHEGGAGQARSRSAFSTRPPCVPRETTRCLSGISFASYSNDVGDDVPMHFPVLLRWCRHESAVPRWGGRAASERRGDHAGIVSELGDWGVIVGRSGCPRCPCGGSLGLSRTPRSFLAWAARRLASPLAPRLASSLAPRLASPLASRLAVTATIGPTCLQRSQGLQARRWQRRRTDFGESPSTGPKTSCTSR